MIRFTKRIAGDRGVFSAGDRGSFDAEWERAIVNAGAAEYVDAPSEPEPEVETADAPEPEESAVAKPARRRRTRK